jgi:hypothetical protein
MSINHKYSRIELMIALIWLCMFSWCLAFMFLIFKILLRLLTSG